MKKPSIYIIIALVLIIIFLCFIIFFPGKNQFDKKIKNYYTYIKTYEERLKEIQNRKVVTIKKFIKLTDQEKEKAYQKALQDREDALQLVQESINKLKEVNKSLEQCNNAFKRKNKVMLMPIFALGTDQKFNLNSQIGLVINGCIYNGLLTNVSIGGGAEYTNRTDFNKTIHGANILFDISINF